MSSLEDLQAFMEVKREREELESTINRLKKELGESSDDPREVECLKGVIRQKQTKLWSLIERYDALKTAWERGPRMKAVKKNPSG